MLKCLDQDLMLYENHRQVAIARFLRQGVPKAFPRQGAQFGIQLESEAVRLSLLIASSESATEKQNTDKPGFSPTVF